MQFEGNLMNNREQRVADDANYGSWSALAQNRLTI